MFLGLRLTAGISEENFRQSFGTSLDAIYGTVLKRLTEEKLLVREKGTLRLTDYGTDISNYVLAQFLYSRTYHSIAELQAEIEEYLVYYNQKRIKLGLKGLSPVQYRAQYLS